MDVAWLCMVWKGIESGWRGQAMEGVCGNYPRIGRHSPKVGTSLVPNLLEVSNLPDLIVGSN